MTKGCVVEMAIANSDLLIKTTNLTDIADLVRVEEDLKSGAIVFLETAAFFEKYDQDIVQLKQAIDKLNNQCAKQGGQIARIGSDILVLTPNANIAIY